MRAAVNLGAAAEPFTPNDVLQLHRLLMAKVPAFEGGQWRTRQNWIGTDRLPEGAEYVPPPPEMIPDLITDLCDFINVDRSSSVVHQPSLMPSSKQFIRSSTETVASAAV